MPPLVFLMHAPCQDRNPLIFISHNAKPGEPPKSGHDAFVRRPALPDKSVKLQCSNNKATKTRRDKCRIEFHARTTRHARTHERRGTMPASTSAAPARKATLDKGLPALLMAERQRDIRLPENRAAGSARLKSANPIFHSYRKIRYFAFIDFFDTSP